MEVHPFFPRFSTTTVGSQISSTLYPPPPPPPQLTTGLLPRMAFPQVPSAHQSPESVAKASSNKNTPEGRLRQGEETAVGAAAAVSVTAPPGIVHNTLRKTKSDMKVIHRYLVQVKNDTREIHEIPPQDLCSYIQVCLLCSEIIFLNFETESECFHGFLGLHRYCQEEGWARVRTGVSESIRPFARATFEGGLYSSTSLVPVLPIKLVPHKLKSSVDHLCAIFIR